MYVNAEPRRARFARVGLEWLVMAAFDVERLYTVNILLPRLSFIEQHCNNA
jgi:hypothetical protein